ncbi:MAG: ATP-binding protein, partial [Anaerolineae bacterium]|nr:ATP-binding protein [Anaerolineae bacterium]
FIASASCASGPAFEGAHINDGMRAASGAIEAIRLTESGLQLKTIENTAPVGMCGSGIVDAVAELRRWQLVNDRGRFARTSARLREGRHGYELLLAPADESGSGRDVVITQEDVNEIQLAKGAIRAGLDVLLRVTETQPEDVAEVIVAGAFGSYLNIESALDIGLFPAYPNAVYRQVGNAAAVGAKWALISRRERARAHQIAAAARYIELTTFPKFNRYFALGMLFPTDNELTKQKE